MDEFESRLREKLYSLDRAARHTEVYAEVLAMMDQIRADMSRELGIKAEQMRLKAEEDARTLVSLNDRAEVGPNGMRFWSAEEIERLGRYYVNGCLPDSYGSHYDVEDELVREGLLREEQKDSESGEFFARVDSPEQADKINEYLLAHPNAGGGPHDSAW